MEPSPLPYLPDLNSSDSSGSDTDHEKLKSGAPAMKNEDTADVTVFDNDIDSLLGIDAQLSDTKVGGGGDDISLLYAKPAKTSTKTAAKNAGPAHSKAELARRQALEDAYFAELNITDHQINVDCKLDLDCLGQIIAFAESQQDFGRWKLVSRETNYLTSLPLIHSCINLKIPISVIDDTKLEFFLTRACHTYPGMTTLDLSSRAENVTDAVIGVISKTPITASLIRLDLGACLNVSDNGVNLLKDFHHLTELFLDRTGVSLLGLSKISPLWPTLKNLHLKGCNRLTDDAFDTIGNMSALQVLDLSENDWLTDAGVSHLWNLDCLEEIVLRYCNNIHGDEINTQPLKKLKTLKLSHCANLKDESMSYLLNDKLVYLDLSSCDKLTDTALTKLIPLKKLQTLNLSDWKHGTDDSIDSFIGLKSLVSLSLYNWELLTDDGLSKLSSLTRLRSLKLFGCAAITNNGLSHLQGFTSLEILNLGFCSAISDEGIAHLTKLPLRVLDLSGCSSLTDDSMKSLRLLDSLRALNLFQVPLLSDVGIAEITEFPQLVNLTLGWHRNDAKFTTIKNKKTSSTETEIGLIGLKKLLDSNSLRHLLLFCFDGGAARDSIGAVFANSKIVVEVKGEGGEGEMKKVR